MKKKINTAIDGFDIEKMAEETKSSIAYMKYYLGIPLNAKSNATTPQEAKKEYEKSMKSPNFGEAKFEAEFAVRDRWDELSLEEVNKAITLDEVKMACKNARPNSNPEFIGLQKWVNLTKTYEEMKEVYGPVLSHCFHHDNLVFLNSTFLKWLTLATTVEYLKDMYQDVGPSEVYFNDATKARIVSKKWAELATTFEEVNEVYKKVNFTFAFESEVIALKKLAVFYGWKG